MSGIGGNARAVCVVGVVDVVVVAVGGDEELDAWHADKINAAERIVIIDFVLCILGLLGLPFWSHAASVPWPECRGMAARLLAFAPFDRS